MEWEENGKLIFLDILTYRKQDGTMGHWCVSQAYKYGSLSSCTEKGSIASINLPAWNIADEASLPNE